MPLNHVVFPNSPSLRLRSTLSLRYERLNRGRMRGYHIRIALKHKSHPSTSASDQFTPSSLFEQLPSHNPKSTARRNATVNPQKLKDYRFGPIRIDWADFDGMNSSALSTAGKGRVNTTGEAHCIMIRRTVFSISCRPSNRDFCTP